MKKRIPEDEHEVEFTRIYQIKFKNIEVLIDIVKRKPCITIEAVYIISPKEFKEYGHDAIKKLLFQKKDYELAEKEGYSFNEEVGGIPFRDDWIYDPRRDSVCCTFYARPGYGYHFIENIEKLKE